MSAGRLGEREIALYDFVQDVHLEAFDMEEYIFTLFDELGNDLYSVLHEAGSVPSKTPGERRDEDLHKGANMDLELGITLKKCVSKLEKLLSENSDLDMDLVARITNKLEEIKSP